jgi:hypothetical protein
MISIEAGKNFFQFIKYPVCPPAWWKQNNCAETLLSFFIGFAKNGTLFFQLDCQDPTDLSEGAGLSHLSVSTGDRMNVDQSAHVWSPALGRWRRFALCCGEEQEVALELSGNEGAAKALVILIDFQNHRKMPVFEVRWDVAFALKQFFDG